MNLSENSNEHTDLGERVTKREREIGKRKGERKREREGGREREREEILPVFVIFHVLFVYLNQ